jgi:hypothetical protein
MGVKLSHLIMIKTCIIRMTAYYSMRKMTGTTLWWFTDHAGTLFKTKILHNCFDKFASFIANFLQKKHYVIWTTSKRMTSDECSDKASSMSRSSRYCSKGIMEVVRFGGYRKVVIQTNQTGSRLAHDRSRKVQFTIIIGEQLLLSTIDIYRIIWHYCYYYYMQWIAFKYYKNCKYKLIVT